MGVVIEKDINIELKINTVALKGNGAYKSVFAMLRYISY